MSRLIFKCPYLKGGHSDPAHRKNYVQYMATRSGAQLVTPNRPERPATKKQQDMVERILRDFPDAGQLHEYSDYCSAPTMANASEFISRVMEDNMGQIVRRENYMEYISLRPRAERRGTHALFSGSSDHIVLEQVAQTVAMHPGNVWLPIISLRREDAARLGYDSAERWQGLLTENALKIAEAMKIPWEQFRWYAAFHDEGHHPHVHMVVYSADGKSGYLTRRGIAAIKKALANEIFRQDLYSIYQEQTQRRDELVVQSRNRMAELIEKMETGTLQSERLEQLMLKLAQELQTVKGKKQYGYLNRPIKSLVDLIVDELAREPRVAEAYDLWYEMREETLRTYRDDMPERLPLSQQKELKQIRNMVIREAEQIDPISAEKAIRLYEQGKAGDRDARQEFESYAERQRRRVLRSCSRLLYHMSRIFRDRTPRQMPMGMYTGVDRKLLAEIREKKLSMGHRLDDYV